MNYREETDLKKQPIAAADVQRLEPSADIGLTAEQVQQRIAAGLANTPVKPPSKSIGAIIASNVFTYFNFIFVAIAVLLLVNGCYKDLTFMPVIIINTLIFAIGIVAVVMIIMGGISYATSQGDPAKVKKGKDTILYGIIGLVVSLLAFAIVNFVLQALNN